jgi:hypothetical protein
MSCARRGTPVGDLFSLRGCRSSCPNGYRTVPAPFPRAVVRVPFAYRFPRGLSGEPDSTCHFADPVRALTTSGRLSRFGQPRPRVSAFGRPWLRLSQIRQTSQIVRVCTNERRRSSENGQTSEFRQGPDTVRSRYHHYRSGLKEGIRDTHETALAPPQYSAVRQRDSQCRQLPVRVPGDDLPENQV